MVHRSLSILIRRLFKTLSVLSLLLLIATLVLWVRSHWRFDQISYWYYRDRNPCAYDVRSEQGYIQFRTDSYGPTFPVTRLGWTHASYAVRSPRPSTSFQWLVRHFGQFIAQQFGYFHQRDVIFIVFPHWSLALLLSILPAASLWRIVRSRCHPAGLCLNCGYDLRATPDRCPECGTEISPDIRGQRSETTKLTSDL